MVAQPPRPAVPPATSAPRDAPAALAHNKACNLEDFSRPELRGLIRAIYPTHIDLFGPSFPSGHEDRKCWEVAMAVRAMRDGGALHRRAEVLGVGAGTEATLFWLTRAARRVFATDLYLDPGGWSHVAHTGMLVDPGRYASFPWNPRRLVVQHMDALDLAYEDGSFDAVFSSSSIEHFGDLDAVRRAVAEAHRVLRPGGILSLATELRLEGPPPGLPGILMFDRAQLESAVLDAGAWGWLGPPLDTAVSAATRAVEVPFSEAIEDIEQGRPQYSRYPHLVLSRDELRWTSVHLALRKAP